MFLKVGFQKARVFSAGGRRRREGTSARHIEFSYHIEVRTLNARRMFREKYQKGGGDLITLRMDARLESWVATGEGEDVNHRFGAGVAYITKKTEEGVFG